jgi:hypothetical protein
MKIEIRHNNSYIIEFNRLDVQGRSAAGGYAFTFIFRGSRQACETPITIFDISMGISLADSAVPLIASIPSSTQIVQCNGYPNNNEQLIFETILTKEKVNALEDCRQESELNLNISLRALTSSSEGLLSSYEASNIVIPRESWLNALKNSGFRQTLLFEIPLPTVPEGLMVILSKAQEFIETGHYKDAVMQCRHVIEKIEMMRDDKNLSRDANSKAHGKERMSMSSIERLLSLREQLKNICQLGAHGSEDFTRSQAKAVLGITLALLAEPTVGAFEF